MVQECECTFTYKTVKAYKAFEDYIQEKIEESEKAIESSNEDLKKKVEEIFADFLEPQPSES